MGLIDNIGTSMVVIGFVNIFYDIGNISPDASFGVVFGLIGVGVTLVGLYIEHMSE